MPKRKTTRRPATPTATEKLKDTWDATVQALSTAESEVEKQVKTLLKKNRIRVEDASALLKQLQTRLERERRRASKDLEARFHALQGRLHKERHHLTRLANEAVQSALATFNIPSRQEVAELTRKVDELSKKIDKLRRR